MIISKKQQEANRSNAQQSCGPKTPEGRDAIRFNALTFGLRTRATILPEENSADYSKLWDELEADWEPQNRTELCYLENMVTSQWLLARLAGSEKKVYESVAFEKQFALLAQADKRRAQLERSFRTAIADMKQSKKERQAQPQQQPAQPAQPAKPAAAPAQKPAAPQAPPPDYVMSEGAETHPASCAPNSPDTR